MPAGARILDVGGRVAYWQQMHGGPAPWRVVVINLEPQPPETPDWIEVIRADARSLPFRAQTFDIVFPTRSSSMSARSRISSEWPPKFSV